MTSPDQWQRRRLRAEARAKALDAKVMAVALGRDRGGKMTPKRIAEILDENIHAVRESVTRCKERDDWPFRHDGALRTDLALIQAASRAEAHETTAILAWTVGVSRQYASHLICKMRRQGRWPFPFPAAHSPEAYEQLKIGVRCRDCRFDLDEED